MALPLEIIRIICSNLTANDQIATLRAFYPLESAIDILRYFRIKLPTLQVIKYYIAKYGYTGLDLRLFSYYGQSLRLNNFITIQPLGYISICPNKSYDVVQVRKICDLILISDKELTLIYNEKICDNTHRIAMKDLWCRMIAGAVPKGTTCNCGKVVLNAFDFELCE